MQIKVPKAITWIESLTGEREIRIRDTNLQSAIPFTESSKFDYMALLLPNSIMSYSLRYPLDINIIDRVR